MLTAETGKTYKLVRRRQGSSIPFGYKIKEDDKEWYEPIPKELDALELAKFYLRSSSWKSVAEWLTMVTGRKISDNGLRKVLRVRKY